MTEWHLEVVPRATMRALDVLAGAEWLKQSAWYLAGGTALGLSAGHRRSQDLDFFTHRKTFALDALAARFKDDEWQTDIIEPGTLYGRLVGAKVSFISYPFFVAKMPSRWYGAVRVLAPEDIAVMKIIAISQRGTKRDFVDLYWYIQHREPLADVLRRVPDQYPTVTHNYQHFLKSLTYFDDADPEEMPTLFFKADWPTIRRYFEREVPKLAKQFLRLD